MVDLTELAPVLVPASKQVQILEHFGRTYHKFIYTSQGSRSCTAATRITVAVLEAFGIDSRPVPVKLRAGLPDLNVSVNLGYETEELTAMGERVAPQMIDKRGWNGHLVVVAESIQQRRRWLLDPSFDQVISRLHEGNVKVEWVPQIELHELIRDASPPGVLLYREFVTPCHQRFIARYTKTKDTDYRRAPGWSFNAVKPVAAAIYKDIRERLGV